MNLPRLIFLNNSIKFILIFFLILFFCIAAQSEIPEKYKIESSLKKCKGSDYKKWSNCYGEYKFPRVEYHGEWLKGNFHGKGVLKEAWGDIYVGDFLNNKADGYGRQDIYHKGEYIGFFEGEVKNDLPHGDGVMEEFNRLKFKGEFKYGYPNGKGERVWEDGTKYIGEFKDNFAHGNGTIFFPNGDTFTGEWFEELMKKGVYKYQSGDVYTGSYDSSGKMSGEAKYEYANGDIYEGEYKDGLFEGFGRFIYSSGSQYVGKFLRGQFSGAGMFKEENKYFYEGGFIEGDFHGKGVLEWIDGDKYIGDFDKGYRDGKGTYIYASGTKYVGEFINNETNGMGKITYSNGDFYEGEFKDNLEHGEGKMIFNNGDVYSGQFEEGYLHGKGKMVYANGDIYEGLWENGYEVEDKKTLAKFTTDEKYYALIIGNNDYEKLEDLDNAVNDAKDLENVLKEKYGFETTLLLNKKSDDTVDAIIEFTQNRKKTDNILIFYAGHGQLVKKQKRGYWLPVDAGEKQDSKWLSNNNIKDLIASSDAKHILLIIDSCFSGSLMRGSADNKSIEKLSKSTLDRLKSKKTRLVITSGGNEQVVDGIGSSKNSVFAEPLIKMLKNNNDVIRSIELFQEVQNYVINNADQTPNHSLIHGTGHDGGEFLFFPVS